ncbi:MAG: adenylate/guanylate cyclase domain-containing protein [Alphaproteobacteria bacterium]|nr:adenylate/guanylate cyclase domain-containing protein [Alphaproteobacteria bacterium]
MIDKFKDIFRQGKIGRPGKGLGRFGAVVGVLLLVAIVMVRYIDPPTVEILRHQLFDFYQRIDPPDLDGVPIVIVDIDESSLAEIGQWPWPRPVIAQIVRQLAVNGAVVIGFDVVFPEPDRVSPPILADQIVGISDEIRQQLRRLPDNDNVFAEIVAATRTVMAQAGSLNADALTDRPPPKKTAVAEIGGDPRLYLFNHDGITRNVPALEDAAHGLGMITILPERDGITRRIPLALNVGGTVVPSLGVEMLRLATGQSTIGIRIEKAEYSDKPGISSVVVGGVPIPTDRFGQVWIRFSNAMSVPYIPAKDILDGSVDPALIAGKFVLIGTSAAGLLDIKTTPVAKSMPGVEVHAHFLANVLTQNLLSRPDYLNAVEYMAMILAALMILILIPRLSAVATLLFGAAVMFTLAGVSWYLYVDQGVLFDVTATAVATFAIYGVLTYVKYVREEADKKMVRRTFSQYLAPAVVDRLAQNPDQVKLGGENRDMTILFSDIRGFTSIAEHTNAEELTVLINRILTPMTEAILEHGGTVDKYIGDCVMAFWNAPIDDADHQRHACLAALDMMRRVTELNASLQEESAESEGRAAPEIRIGVGLNSGVCCVGNIGSDQRFDYSVLGDAVNLSSRLEGQTSFYGAPIVVGESTASGAADLALIHIDRIKVKGRQQPVRIFALVGDQALAEQPDFQRFIADHDAFMEAYFEQHWDVASDLLPKCRAQSAGLDLSMDAFYDLFAERIDSFRAEPPGESWDGAFVATKK